MSQRRRNTITSFVEGVPVVATAAIGDGEVVREGGVLVYDAPARRWRDRYAFLYADLLLIAERKANSITGCQYAYREHTLLRMCG